MEGEYQVKFEHYRFPSDGVESEPEEFYVGRHGKAFRYYRGMSKWIPSERGGYTICQLGCGAGLAECSPRDNFCYRTGRRIALGRARKALSKVNVAG